MPRSLVYKLLPSNLNKPNLRQKDLPSFFTELTRIFMKDRYSNYSTNQITVSVTKYFYDNLQYEFLSDQ